MLKKYSDFRFQNLLFHLLSVSEAYIECASDLIFKLREIKVLGGRSGEIAEILLSAIGEKEVGELSQNFFDLSDKDDKVTFISSNRIPWDDWNEDESPALPYEMPGRSELKVGRAIRYMLTQLGVTISDKDLEDFVNAFKATTESGLQFKLVAGDEIAKYYKLENYFSSGGTLGGSCMKDEGKKTFKLYTENETKVKLLILIDVDGKIHGRALVWKLKESPAPTKFLMDRVYTNRDSDIIKFRKFADENDWMYKKYNVSYINQSVQFIYKGSEVNGVCTVKVKGDFSTYPYVDTMAFLSKDKDELSNVSLKRGFKLKDVWGKKEKCDFCNGDILVYYHGKEELCDDCSDGHLELKKLGVETKWNKRV